MCATYLSLCESPRSENYNAWLSGDETLDVDLKFLVSEKSETMNVRTDIRILKALGDEFENTRPKGVHVTGSEDQLLIDELDLLIKQCNYDLNALEVWKSKCLDTETHAQTNLKEFAIAQNANLVDGAEAWMKKHILFLAVDRMMQTRP